MLNSTEYKPGDEGTYPKPDEQGIAKTLKVSGVASATALIVVCVHAEADEVWLADTRAPAAAAGPGTILLPAAARLLPHTAG